jgi:hypothetical protein
MINRPTKHAIARMAQRGIKLNDADLIVLVGTEVSDGYLVLRKDYDEAERALKLMIERLRKVVGKRLIFANGQIVTVYSASESHKRQLIRHAYKRDCAA